MKRRTRKNPTATIRDFTEGDVIPVAASDYIKTLEPSVVSDPDNVEMNRIRLGDAYGPPFDPLDIILPNAIDGGSPSSSSGRIIDGGTP